MKSGIFEKLKLKNPVFRALRLAVLWKMLTFAAMFDTTKARWHRFREWQQQPHRVKPMSQEEHTCPTCGRRFVGNYCPQCGQSSQIGRYSLRNALLLFIDVWGVGNRGMFRSIRDLLLRPGYMIRDYLRGMQMAYFPPFKMFFLLFALSLIIDSGLNIRGINRIGSQEKEIEAYGKQLTHRYVDNGPTPDAQPAAAKPRPAEGKSGRPATAAEGKSDRPATAAKQSRKERLKAEVRRIDRRLDEWTDRHESYLLLFMLLLYSGPLWLMIRRCPAIPDMRFSECLVAMVYIVNMISIYGFVPQVLCFSLKATTAWGLASTLLLLVAVKQLTGYSYRQTVWRVIAAVVPFVGLLLLVAAVVVGVELCYALITVG